MISCIMCGQPISPDMFQDFQVFCSIACSMVADWDFKPHTKIYQTPTPTVTLEDPYIGLDSYDDYDDEH